MKERPILFSAPMVRALLGGSKTQTRRIVKGQVPEWATFTDEEDIDGREFFMVCGEKELSGLRPIIDAVYCPYGQPGDRLWVREACWIASGATDIGGVVHCADREGLTMGGMKKRPSIHMPRWASRILLEITSVRVERLQDISEADAKAEGAQRLARVDPHRATYRGGYRDLWESINGLGSWEANPWVWVVEFKRVTP